MGLAFVRKCYTDTIFDSYSADDIKSCKRELKESQRVAVLPKMQSHI